MNLRATEQAPNRTANIHTVPAVCRGRPLAQTATDQAFCTILANRATARTIDKVSRCTVLFGKPSALSSRSAANARELEIRGCHRSKGVKLLVSIHLAVQRPVFSPKTATGCPSMPVGSPRSICANSAVAPHGEQYPEEAVHRPPGGTGYTEHKNAAS
eukprot:COSAG02_NODE_11098_length_1793_cov_1.318182_1_plen_158_part_00